MKIKKFKYQKPIINSKKIQLNFFFSETPFLDAIDDLLVPNVFAATGGCFLAGTKILMADGTTKDIQKITSEDTVASFDLEKQMVIPEKVSKLIFHPYYKNGYYLINDTLKVTGNHPMWIPNKKKWDRLDSLVIGDSLLDNSNHEITIKSIKKIRGINNVYNLHLVGENHNYFADNILVHNGTDGDNPCAGCVKS